MKKLLCVSPFYSLEKEFVEKELKGVKIEYLDIDYKKVITEKEMKKLYETVSKFNPDAIFSSITEARQFLKLDKKFFDAVGKNLKFIQQNTAGYNHIDVVEAKKKGIIVSRTPQMNSESTAEMAFLLMLTVSRKMKENINYMRKGNWKMRGVMGSTLKGKQLGIIGFGFIGSEMARKSQPFGMNVVYFDIHKLDDKKEKELKVSYRTFDELIKTSDIISIHCPLNKHTKHLISKKQFDMMKETAIVVNTSRGPVINELDLIEALEKKKILSAALDVFEQEPVQLERIEKLWKLGVVATPHIAGITKECWFDMEYFSLINIKRVLISNEKPEGEIILKK